MSRLCSPAVGLACAAALGAQEPVTAGHPFRPDQFAALSWRNLGPANMGGRMTDIAVDPLNIQVWYVGTAGGGVWKTANAGTTWTPIFDDQGTVSIGDVAVAPGNSDVVWVGTGEENARNSVQWGDGVYKSTDAGETFRHMGLRESFQIGHVEIDPRDSDVVFVAALGRLWGGNPDRGVFRTTDGGETWQKVLYLDDATGCIDVRIDPHRPDTVYACMYERRRDGFDTNDPAVRFGAKAGIYRSTDRGETWERMTAGLPSCAWGRSGLALSATTPGRLFAIIETERSGWATGDSASSERASAYMGVNTNRDSESGGVEVLQVTPGQAAEEAGLRAGDRLIAMGTDEIQTYRDFQSALRRRQADDEEALKVRRGEETVELKITYRAKPGTAGRRGGNENGPHSTRLGGQVANVQDQQGENGFETGGVFRSDDHGQTWQRVNSLTDRPFYYSVLAVDPSDDKNLYSCGVQFFASFDGGAKFEQVQRRIHSDFHAIWVDPTDSDHVLLAGDGGLHETWDRTEHWRLVNNIPVGQFYHANADSSVPYRVYGGLQDNGTWGGPSRTRYREGATIADWVTVFGGDGFRARIDPEDPNVVFATSQNGGIGRVDMASGGAGGRVDKPEDAGPFNWDTPFFLSPHNPRVLYFAGRRACRSLNRGSDSRTISPDLGLTERGTATAFAESPLVEGLLYVGTDDGALWRSEDGGQTWVELHDRLLGMDGPRYVSHLAPSRHEAGRVYVALDGHRSDDLATHVLVSEDRGDSWRPIAANVENEPAHVVAEDLRRQDLLFLGTEFGCYCSPLRGEHWFRLGALPTVAVRDLDIQDREADLVAATHGRGIWVADIEPLRQLTTEIAESAAHLFAPADAVRWQLRSRVLLGHRHWTADNPPPGTAIYLWLRDAPEEPPEVSIHDIEGEQIAVVTGRRTAGLQALQWPLTRGDSPAGGGRRPFAGRPRGGRPAPIEAGNYSVRFRHGDVVSIQPLTVRDDPGGSTPFTQPVLDPTDRRN